MLLLECALHTAVTSIVMRSLKTPVRELQEAQLLRGKQVQLESRPGSVVVAG